MSAPTGTFFLRIFFPRVTKGKHWTAAVSDTTWRSKDNFIRRVKSKREYMREKREKKHTNTLTSNELKSLQFGTSLQKPNKCGCRHCSLFLSLLLYYKPPR